MMPRYTHDCTNCQYLGEDGDFDLYACRSVWPVRLTFLARYGDDGPEYASLDEEVLETAMKGIRGDTDDREIAVSTRTLLEARRRYKEGGKT